MAIIVATRAEGGLILKEGIFDIRLIEERDCGVFVLAQVCAGVPAVGVWAVDCWQ